MLNMNLINAVIDLVSAFEEAKHIIESTETILSRTISWYEGSDITDIETLAAVVLSGELPHYQTWTWIINQKNFFFPTKTNLCNSAYCDKLDNIFFN